MIDVETHGPWVARVEDEETSFDGSTRMEAVAAALDSFAGSMDERHDWVVDACTAEPVVLATVYEDTEGEICWRLADD